MLEKLLKGIFASNKIYHSHMVLNLGLFFNENTFKLNIKSTIVLNRQNLDGVILVLGFVSRG